MNQQQLRAYVNLIQQLLACPSGEEWILLRQNEGLVTPELVQVMEQVATQLAHQGNAKEAKFLHNLAGQIHHLFVAQTVPPSPEDDREAAYLELIKDLLDCPEGTEGKLLAAHQDLIGPGLVRMMQQVAAQFTAKGDRETAHYLNQWATELSRLWLEQHDFQPSPKPSPDPNHPEPPPLVAQTPYAQPPSKPPSPVPPAQEEPEDLWAEPLAPPSGQPFSQRPSTPATTTPPSASAPSPPPTVSFVQSELSSDLVVRQLEAIAAALTHLSEALTAGPPPPDPLWYMETLERACAGGWILTSDEIQRLIGIKPSCPRGHDSFQRGCWVFIKAGKLGAQTAWRVEKGQTLPA